MTLIPSNLSGLKINKINKMNKNKNKQKEAIGTNSVSIKTIDNYIVKISLKEGVKTDIETYLKDVSSQTPFLRPIISNLVEKKEKTETHASFFHFFTFYGFEVEITELS